MIIRTGFINKECFKFFVCMKFTYSAEKNLSINEIYVTCRPNYLVKKTITKIYKINASITNHLHLNRYINKQTRILPETLTSSWLQLLPGTSWQCPLPWHLHASPASSPVLIVPLPLWPGTLVCAHTDPEVRELHPPSKMSTSIWGSAQDKDKITMALADCLLFVCCNGTFTIAWKTNDCCNKSFVSSLITSLI